MTNAALAPLSAALPFAVARINGEFQLLAVAPIPCGTRLFRIHGVETHRPTKYSVQIGDEVHIDVTPQTSFTDHLDRYPWRFMNHACDPNTVVVGREVVAIRSIAHGEQITFNYNTTEFEIAAPFRCECGSPFCARDIRGFRNASPAERRRLRPWTAAYLRRLDAIGSPTRPTLHVP